MTKRNANAQRDQYTAERTKPFTNKEMQAMTAVSLMSLHLWRQGTVTKTMLPAKKNDDGTIAYPVRSTLRWLKKHDIALMIHPDEVDVVANGSTRRKKSGPITRMADRRPLAYRH